MLKMTGVKLEKISDIDKYLFIEKGLRGGISYIAKRYSEANNKYIKNCGSTKLSIYIEYLDMNDLNRWEMSGYLPYGGFKWLKNAGNFDINSVIENSSIGCILQVDLEYFDELHVLQTDYPLAPEKLAILYDMLSDYCKKVVDEYGIKVGGVKKLGDKTNYIVHYKNLRLYLPLGMEQRLIHSVLKFKQSDWMKTYIDFNTEKRKNATSKFEKRFF